MYRRTTENTPQYKYRRTAVEISLNCGLFFDGFRCQGNILVYRPSVKAFKWINELYSFCILEVFC